MSSEYETLKINYAEVLAKLEAAEKEIEHYKKRWLDTKSERDNLRVQFEQERAINAVLVEVCTEVIRNSHDIIAKKRCSEALTKAKDMRDGE